MVITGIITCSCPGSFISVKLRPSGSSRQERGVDRLGERHQDVLRVPGQAGKLQSSLWEAPYLIRFECVVDACLYQCSRSPSELYCPWHRASSVLTAKSSSTSAKAGLQALHFALPHIIPTDVRL